MRSPCPISGFTLLELMVAMVIFIMIGVGSHAMLHSLLKAREVEKAHAQKLAQVQKALWVMTQDMAQMDAVTFKAPDGPYEAGFVRHGWSNPLALARSDLLQVDYRREGAVLKRYYWPQALEAVRQEQVLLEGVSNFSVRKASERSVEIVVEVQGFGVLRRVVEVPDL